MNGIKVFLSHKKEDNLLLHKVKVFWNLLRPARVINVG
jgi:hypothetical protein